MMFSSLEATARFLVSERGVSAMISRLAREHGSGVHRIRNVTVIDRYDRPSVAGLDVVVRDGLVDEISGHQGTVDVADIDGTGMFLTGGLVDAHVHTHVTSRQNLLHLLHGVTGVREMCGFPWMLDMRELARNGHWIAPRSMIAGHIIATHPLDGFATVVGSTDDARAVVMSQAADGYDAIKVHNRLNAELYGAVAASAAEAGLPLVGHVPHDVSLSEAIGAGQVTVEHVKGYYQDWDLEMTEEPWLKLTKNAEIWNCPTLVTSLEGSRGAEARQRMTTDAARLLGPEIIGPWGQLADHPENRGLAIIRERSESILNTLATVTDRWLVGTDSGGSIGYLVPGESLHEEIRLMQAAGIPRDQVLHAATHAISSAHPNAGFPDSVTEGQPADFVLVESDPRVEETAFARISGVMLGGRWFDRSDLDAIRSAIVEIDGDVPDHDTALSILAAPDPHGRNEWHWALTAEVLRASGRDASVVPQWRFPVPDV